MNYLNVGILAILPFLLPIVGSYPALAGDEPKAEGSPGETAVKTKPRSYFRWLQMDTKTADSLIKAVADKRLLPEGLAQRIDKLVTEGRMKEMAKFQQDFLFRTSFVLSSSNADLRPVAQAKNKPMIEIKGMIDFESRSQGNGETISLIYSASLRGSVATPAQDVTQECSSQVMFRGSGWLVLQRWQLERDATVLLARIVADIPEQQTHVPGENLRQPGLYPFGLPHLELEMREIKRSNLPQILKATAENNAKAIDWLRQHSALVGSASTSLRQGGRGEHKHCLGKAGDNALPNDSMPGITMEYDMAVSFESDERGSKTTPSSTSTVIEPHEPTHISIVPRIRASYLPPGVGEKGSCSLFESENRFKHGVPQIVLPASMPAGDGPVVVAIMTLSLEIFR